MGQDTKDWRSPVWNTRQSESRSYDKCEAYADDKELESVGEPRRNYICGLGVDLHRRAY